ncbi:MAG: hypothetical protein K0Q72_3670 [Armatimonadetes bacterium]|jgi:hypothetical protein|nr:hypothetical protein [Armatimonadota bacterium]
MNPISSGSYSVTINQLNATQFSVTVVGNNDGRLVADGSGPQKHSVGRISIGFLRANNTYIAPNEAGSSGATNSGGAYVGSPWVVTLDADVVRFNAPSITNDVGAFGENMFSGIVTMASAESPARITAALQNGTQQWYTEGAFLGGQGDLTPEPASLALALPGLLPLGLMLRRRRRIE